MFLNNVFCHFSYDRKAWTMRSTWTFIQHTHHIFFAPDRRIRRLLLLFFIILIRHADILKSTSAKPDIFFENDSTNISDSSWSALSSLWKIHIKSHQNRERNTFFHLGIQKKKQRLGICVRLHFYSYKFTRVINYLRVQNLMFNLTISACHLLAVAIYLIEPRLIKSVLKFTMFD